MDSIKTGDRVQAHPATDAWITADFTAQAISAKVGKAHLMNNFNGAQAVYRDGIKLWSDKGVSDLTA